MDKRESQSSLKTFSLCPRKYQIQEVECIRPVAAADELSIGSVTHGGLEVIHATFNVEEALKQADQLCDPYSRAMVRAMLLGYVTRWGDESLRAEGVEIQFEYEFSGWTIRGQMDGLRSLAEDAAHCILLENKTCSPMTDLGPTSQYWLKLRLDRQISIYYDGAAEKGYPVKSCLYNVLRKPGLKPLMATPEERRRFTKKGELDKRHRLENESPDEYEARILLDMAENPDSYFARQEVVRTVEELEAAREDLRQTLSILDYCYRSNSWPRNPDACFAYGRPCEFWGVCCGSQSLSDESTFRRVDRFPELSPDKEAA